MMWGNVGNEHAFYHSRSCRGTPLPLPVVMGACLGRDCAIGVVNGRMRLVGTTLMAATCWGGVVKLTREVVGVLKFTRLGTAKLERDEKNLAWGRF